MGCDVVLCESVLALCLVLKVVGLLNNYFMRRSDVDDHAHNFFGLCRPLSLFGRIT